MSGAEAVDLPLKDALIPSLVKDFKGNMDITALERLLKEKGREHIPLVMMTVTNNSCAGQPVSMGCIRRVSGLCRSYKIPFFIDACRFAENSWFVKTREPGCKGRSVKQLAQEMFSYADGCTMSGKKDGLVNIGGFLALNDDEFAQKARNILIVTEGFPTYGGLAGRDLEAFAQGLEEVVDEDYLKYRIRSTEYVVEKLDALGVPVFKPAGGHAVYLDAKAFLPHVPPQHYPGHAIACALYLEGGIRSCEIGSVMFGKTDPATGEFQPAMLEMVRLAIPRRVYTQSHMDYVVECLAEVFAQRDKIRACASPGSHRSCVTSPPDLSRYDGLEEPSLDATRLVRRFPAIGLNQRLLAGAIHQAPSLPHLCNGIGPCPHGDELPLVVVQFHARHGDFVPGAQDVPRGDKVITEPRPQIVDTHVDGADLGKSLGHRLHGLPLHGLQHAREMRPGLP